MNTVWDYILFLYQTKHGLTSGEVEFMAVKDILFKSVTGYSNTDISIYFKLPFYYVCDIILEWLGFTGWRYSLSLNPYPLYVDNFEVFKYNIYSKTSTLKDKSIEDSWRIIKRYKELEELYEKRDSS